MRLAVTTITAAVGTPQVVEGAATATDDATGSDR